MANIRLTLSRDLFNDSFWPLMFDYSHRFECYMGSAGSSKSYSVTQKIIIRCCNEPGIRVLVCRRWATTIRQTVFELFKDVLKSWELNNYIKINESDFRITFPNGSEILFSGLDTETKLLSLANISCIFIEEAYEVPKDIFDQLNLRMRGKQANQQIIMCWNPISQNSWLYEFVNNPPESFIFHHSTYKDNKFLTPEYVKTLEEMKTRNPQKWKIYGLGEWGIDTDGLVLTNWETQDFDEFELAKIYEHRSGSDLGYIDPTTIVASLYDKNNGIIYVYDEYYKSGVQLDEVYKALCDMKLNKSTVWFDSAEPRTIDYFRRKGVNAKPCIKGANSIDARIAFLQNNKIIVKPTCTNLIRELSNFSYEKDRHTGKFIDGKYTHEFSHAIDGLGYAYSDIYTRGRIRTLDKSILGL